MERKLREPTNAWQRFLIAELKAAEARVRHAEGCLKRCKPGSFGYWDCSAKLQYEKEFEITAWETYEAQWDAPVDMEEFEKERKA
jgi:hypothetical protein